MGSHEAGRLLIYTYAQGWYEFLESNSATQAELHRARRSCTAAVPGPDR
jgi:hypothetical protein